MHTHTKHPRLTDTNRRVPFVKPVFCICNNICFLCKASLYVLLAGFLYCYMNEFLTNRNHSFLTCTVNSQVPNEKDSNKSKTNGNSLKLEVLIV
jgi:hypothetical protein